MEGVPAHGRGVGQNDLYGPFLPKSFYDSIDCLLVLLFWQKKQNCKHGKGIEQVLRF